MHYYCKMAHTFSICTPTPGAQICYNMDTDKNNYFSFHTGTPFFSYTYIPQFSINPCTTVKLADRIVTTCPDVTNTIYLPSMNSIQNQLDMIDSLLKNTQDRTNQCIQKMDHITGVSSGDTYQSVHRTTPDINIDTNNGVPQINYEILVNTQECNMNTEVKCKSCGCIWIKEYLLKIEEYWCQMCSIGHVFTPFTVFDFAPFSSVEELKSLEERMMKQHHNVYHGIQGYWIN